MKRKIKLCILHAYNINHYDKATRAMGRPKTIPPNIKSYCFEPSLKGLQVDVGFL